MKKKCFSFLRVTSLVFVLINLYPSVVSAQPLNKEAFNFTNNTVADNLSHVSGSHVYTMGVRAVFQQVNGQVTPSGHGTFNFTAR